MENKKLKLFLIISVVVLLLGTIAYFVVRRFFPEDLKINLNQKLTRNLRFIKNRDV